MESQPQFVISSENPVGNLAQTLDSNDQNPPQTLVSYDEDLKSKGLDSGQIPISDNNQKTLFPDSKTENGVSKIDISKPLLSENDLNKTHSGTKNSISGGEEENSSSKRRRKKSRWDPVPSSEPNDDMASRKKKSRWADDTPMINLGVIDFDPETQVLNSRLLEINRILLSGLPLDDRPEGARSPSPEPVYDAKGIRINTRENRAKERLGREKQEIIQQMIKKNPAFRPPADYRPPKVQKKLYIPMKEYPGYNFIGLIIGPRGNTQKRMEKETGAKIVIRGKGSVKEGRIGQKRDLKFDPAENEDLHVLVEADTQEAVDAAAGMVEKLLKPVDEVLNEHKRQQLRELATLNGTIKDEEYCRLCGEQGHRQFGCPSRFSTFKSDVLCKICGDGGHPTIDCPVKGTTGKKMDDEYQNFLAKLGGTMPEGVTKQISGTLAITSGNELGANGVTKQIKEYDETNLYIGYLSPTLEDDGLIRLFSPFGTIVNAKVVKDKVTGLSKGYGFVKYTNIQEANTAITSMNGQRIEGRTIAVRVAGKVPQPVGPTSTTIHTYTISTQPVSAYPSQTLGSSNNYGPAPVPLGPPVVPTMYTPYGVQYPPVQPLYTYAPSFTYAPYYNVNPQQPPSYVSQPQSLANVPWASNVPVPQKTTPGDDMEYEKFMAEMK